MRIAREIAPRARARHDRVERLVLDIGRRGVQLRTAPPRVLVLKVLADLVIEPELRMDARRKKLQCARTGQATRDPHWMPVAAETHAALQRRVAGRIVAAQPGVVSRRVDAEQSVVQIRGIARGVEVRGYELDPVEHTVLVVAPRAPAHEVPATRSRDGGECGQGCEARQTDRLLIDLVALRERSVSRTGNEEHRADFVTE